MLLKVLLIPIIIVAYISLVGCYVKCHVSVLKGFHSFGVGFITIIGIYQIVALPFMVVDVNFDIYVTATLLIFGCTFVVCVIFQINHWQNDWSKRITRHNIDLGIILTIVIMLFQMFMVVRYQFSDADDSYYVAEINNIVETNHFYFCDPASGNESLPFQDQYKLILWEPLAAVICKVFGINAAVLTHTIVPIITIAATYSILYSLICEITDGDKKYIGTVFLFTSLLHVFCGEMGVCYQAYLGRAVWWGRSIFYSACLTFLLTYAIRTYKKQTFEKGDILVYSILGYASFGTCAVAIYLYPLAYFSLMVPYYIYNHKTNSILASIVPVISLLPNVIMKYCIMQSSSIKALLVDNVESIDYWSTFNSTFGREEIFIWLLFSMAIILVSRNKELKVLLAGCFLTSYLTYLNPLVKDFMAEKITGTSVYWRLFYLIHFSFWPIIGYYCFISSKNMRDLKKVGKIIIYVIPLLCIVWMGKNIYDPETYKKADNLEKIDKITIDLADSIINDYETKSTGSTRKRPYVMMMEPYYLEMRQYTGKINLVYHRYIKSSNAANGDLAAYEYLSTLYPRLYGGEMDGEAIEEIKSFPCDYLVIYNSNRNKMVDYRCVYEGETVSVYEITK